MALAIEAYRAMKRAGLARQLVVVGDETAARDPQRAHPDVLFCGAQTGLALAAHYASADVFLFSERDRDFPGTWSWRRWRADSRSSPTSTRRPARTSSGAIRACWSRAARVALFVSAAVEAAQAPATVARMRERAREAALALDWDAVVDGFERFLSGGEVAGARARHRDAGGRSMRPRPRPEPGGVRARPEKQAWHGAH